MLIISAEDLDNLCDPVKLTDRMELALVKYLNQDFIMPDRMHVSFGENTLLLMPAQSGNHFSTKLVSLFPANSAKNKPVLFGTVILNNGETGEPLALLNGAKLTAVRTAAVGAAGIRQISPENCSSLGIVGAGVQGIHQVQFACKTRPIKNVFLWDSHFESMAGCLGSLKGLLPESIDIQLSSGVDDLVEKSEIIITATSSGSPVLPNCVDLLKGKHIIAIGSYKPNMRELPEALFRLVDNVYTDTEFAVEETGDLITPLEKSLISADQVVNLAQLINGDVSIDRTRTTLFKSVGMALFDLFTAEYLYESAIEKGVGQKVEL